MADPPVLGLFDSGAIISKTAKVLQAKQINCPTHISGFAGNTTIRHLVKFILCSSHSAGEGREVTFHVIEGYLPVRIPDVTTVQKLSFKLSFLCDWQLADWSENGQLMHYLEWMHFLSSTMMSCAKCRR